MDEKSDILKRAEEKSEDLRKTMDQAERKITNTLQEKSESVRQTAAELGGKASTVLKQMSDDLYSVGNRITSSVKKNPLPYAGIGVGLGLLGVSVLSLRRGNGRNLTESAGMAGREKYESTPYAEENFPDQESNVFEEKKWKKLQEKTGHVLHDVKEKARSIEQRARKRSEQMPAEVIETVKEYPFVTGSTMFCLGMLIGFLFPSTKPESETIGRVGDRLREKAHEIKEEAMESAHRVVEETKKAVSEEFESFR